MKLSLSAQEQNGAINLSLRISLIGPEELRWGLDHCTPHRRFQWAVSWADFPRWQAMVGSGHREESTELCQPFVLLWGQPSFEIESSTASETTVVYRNQVPDGLIARALVERLRESEDLEEIERDLAMLELEAGTTGFRTEPTDSVDLSASLFGIRHAAEAAHPPEPGPRPLAPTSPAG